MDDFRERLHETLKIKDAAVIECGRNAYVMQRTGVAMVVLNCVNQRVEYVRRIANLLRSGRASLHEVIIIGIHTRNHVRAELIRQRNLLSFAKRGLRREHHLEVILFRLQRSEQGAPKSHIVKTLYVCHNALSRMLPRQAVCRLDIMGRYVTGKGGQPLTNMRVLKQH